MSNDFYNESGNPAALTRGASAVIRSEFTAVRAGFDKVPSLLQQVGSTLNYVVAAGPADAWTATVAPSTVVAYTDGMQVRLKFPSANATTTPTANINGLGAKTIVTENASALGAGDISVNMIATLTYNSSSGKLHMTDTAVGSVTAAAASAAAADASRAAAALNAAAAAASEAQAAASEAQAAAIVLGNFLQSGTGARSRTYSAKVREVARSVMDFGAIADGTNHPLSDRYASLAAAQVDYPFATALTQSIDWAAFTAAINSLDDVAHYSRGGVIVVPRGEYYLSEQIAVLRRLSFFGEGEGFAAGGIWSPPTSLIFPANTNGFRVYSTLDSPAPVHSGAFSYICNMSIRSLAAAGAGTGHGITSSSQIYVKDVRIEGFSQNGVNIVASEGSNGNANQFSLENVTSSANRGHGFYIQGTDVNAGTIYKCDASANAGYGYFDEGFLGNTYIGCHAAGNLSGSSPNFVDYKTTNANARHVFIGCYSELGLNELVAPSMAIGGVLGGSANAPTSNAFVMTGSVSVREPIQHINEQSALYKPYFKNGGNDASNTVFGFGLTNTPGTYYIVDYYAGGAVPWFRWNINGALPAMSLPAVADASLRVHGPLFGEGVLFGDTGTNFAVKYGVAAPVAGTWARGDRVWNSVPTVGQPKSWACTVAGTPGTWVSEGNL